MPHALPWSQPEVPSRASEGEGVGENENGMNRSDSSRFIARGAIGGTQLSCGALGFDGRR